MPRKARIDIPDAVHRVIIRGIERTRTFRDDLDRDRFLDRLATILGETATACYAWTLLPHHAHFLLRTGNVPIAPVMHRLRTGFAQ